MNSAAPPGVPDAAPSARELTRLLRAAQHGDGDAERELAPAIYHELHALAHHHMASTVHGSVLQTTALLHEAWMKLQGAGAAFADRAGFYAYASRAMRSIVIDDARRRLSGKRGGGVPELELTAEFGDASVTPEQVLRLDDILSSLERIDPRLARLIELRVFGGLNFNETGKLLGVSESTVKRDWRRVRAFIGERLDGAPE